MATYRVRFNTKIELTVNIDADDEDTASDVAWELAQEYLNTLLPDSHGVSVVASLDGIGADDVAALDSRP